MCRPIKYKDSDSFFSNSTTNNKDTRDTLNFLRDSLGSLRTTEGYRVLFLLITISNNPFRVNLYTILI